MKVFIIHNRVLPVWIQGERSKFSNELKKIFSNFLSSDEDSVQVVYFNGFSPKTASAREVVLSVYFDPSQDVVTGLKLVQCKNALKKLLKESAIDLEDSQLTLKSVTAEDLEMLEDSLTAKKPISSEAKIETKPENEFDYESKAKLYVAKPPLYSFDRVILPKEVKEKIEDAIGILQCEQKVFDEWGLYEILPHPSTSLSFFGPSGTGKTMAAEAVANKLGKKILKVSYADVESKFHGEGPKMVKAIFIAARNADAVLFFDEADSLLSKRLTNVTQGSEQAINSMRSQLLISLEEFRGIVIFATNLVVNYDKAFLTRLISVEFKTPDVGTRKQIWDVHIVAPDDGKQHKLNIPLASDVNTSELAEKYDFVGREIRNAVVAACVKAALRNRPTVSQADFIDACEKIVTEKKSLAEAKDHTESSPGKDLIKEALLRKLTVKPNKQESSEEESHKQDKGE